MNRNLSGVKLFKTDAQHGRALFKLLFNQSMLRLKKQHTDVEELDFITIEFAAIFGALDIT